MDRPSIYKHTRRRGKSEAAWTTHVERREVHGQVVDVTIVEGARPEPRPEEEGPEESGVIRKKTGRKKTAQKTAMKRSRAAGKSSRGAAEAEDDLRHTAKIWALRRMGR